MTCKECKISIPAKNPIYDGICGSCMFWTELKQLPNKVVISGKCYQIDPNENSEFKGFGGLRFKIQFLDGTFTETTNLWHNGIIPEHFLGRFPDNAKFVD